VSVWIDGRRAKQIDVNDRGLHYGDGVFESMAVRGRRVRFLDWHLQRLFTGCSRLKIAAPPRAVLRAEIERVAGRGAYGVLKLIVTRGSGARGYAARALTGTRRILLGYPPPEVALAEPSPVRLRICRTRVAHHPELAGIKSLNRLESVLARTEWRGSQFADGLMLDRDDRVVCGTMSNVFLRVGNRLFTPRLDRCGVHGVMRRWVIQAAPHCGLKVREAQLGLGQLCRADEIFITNALIGILSVKSIARLAWRAQTFVAAQALRAELDAS
jgi:4-amino-4-deoxychorismate lyase